LPVVAAWFSRRDLGGGVTMLTEPYVDPFLRANCWHVRGRDRDLLVDTGLGISSLRDFAPDLFEREVVAVATHAHYDHIGGLHEFETRVAHPLDAEAIRQPDFASLRVTDFPDELRAEFGAEAELIIARPSADFDVAAYRVRAVEPTRLVEEGEVIDLGDRAFEVLHLPGHTPGSIALWEAKTGVLFAGDVVYEGRLLDELPESNVEDYLSSMERLRALPVTVVHAGHYESFGRERLLELISAYVEQVAHYGERTPLARPGGDAAGD
jgi:glyoxylase-like metal-dependent hydrolase (beta-lactamase superfamily II)